MQQVAGTKLHMTVAGANKAIPETAEIVVIGSGLGGLTAAALMANQGKDVLVCESHYELGGCAHAFYYREDGTVVPSDKMKSSDKGNLYCFEAGPSLYVLKTSLVLASIPIPIPIQIPIPILTINKSTGTAVYRPH